MTLWLHRRGHRPGKLLWLRKPPIKRIENGFWRILFPRGSLLFPAKKHVRSRQETGGPSTGISFLKIFCDNNIPANRLYSLDNFRNFGAHQSYQRLLFTPDAVMHTYVHVQYSAPHGDFFETRKVPNSKHHLLSIPQCSTRHA